MAHTQMDYKVYGNDYEEGSKKENDIDLTAIANNFKY